MNIKLTEEQVRLYPAIKWLIADGPRAQGKSTLMALAFLEKGFDCMGFWVSVYDHFPTFEAGKFTLRLIQRLFEQSSTYEKCEIEFKFQTNQFRIFPVDKNGKEKKERYLQNFSYIRREK